MRNGVGPRPGRPSPHIRKSGVVTTAAKAVRAVRDQAVVAVSGFNLAATPEYLILELYRAYRKTGHPSEIFLIADALPAIPERGLDVVAKDLYVRKDSNFLRGVSVPFLGFSPWLQKLVVENRIEAYSWPMGVSAYWFREVASGRPGVISKIGIDTAIDPRKGGGRLNRLASANDTCTVKRIVVDHKEYLLYEAPKPTVALVRATTADIRGNLTMEEEAMRGTVLSIAQATKAHPQPGVVLAQVKRLANEASDPRMVEVPGPFVDFIVVSPEAFHWQAGSTPYDPSFSGGPSGIVPVVESPAEPEQLVIARRVLKELFAAAVEKGSPVVVNLGIGVPALVSRLAIQEKVSDYIITVVESGQWGGLALPGIDFGVAIGPFALSTMPDMFSNFEGGVIDAASLGFLQVDRNGDVNPSMLPGRIYGPGGFPVIAGGSPRIYFAGAFMAGDAKITIEGGKLKIVKEGQVKKFVKKSYRNFFSAKQALRYGKEVLYVTERAVFRLSEGGLVLREVAPGLDVEKDVIGNMEFRPELDRGLREMDEDLFRKDGPMELYKEIRRA